GGSLDSCSSDRCRPHDNWAATLLLSHCEPTRRKDSAPFPSHWALVRRHGQTDRELSSGRSSVASRSADRMGRVSGREFAARWPLLGPSSLSRIGRTTLRSQPSKGCRADRGPKPSRSSSLTSLDPC